jgi:hypothetical protein
MKQIKNKIEFNGNIIRKKYLLPSINFYSSLKLLLHFLGFKQPIEYQPSKLRAQFEYDTLLLWNHKRLNVPKVVNKGLDYLDLEIIKGQSLDLLFKTSNQNEIFEIIAICLKDMSNRHKIAFEQNEPRLCHLDANLRNMIKIDQNIFHIDFEMGRISENVFKWAEREFGKFLVSIYPYIHRDNIPKLAEILKENYAHESIIIHLIRKKLATQPKKWNFLKNKYINIKKFKKKSTFQEAVESLARFYKE